MELPWTFFTWEQVYEEQKYFVQVTLSDSPETKEIMNRIVFSVSCKAATKIEQHCLEYLTESITRFKTDNPEKEPDECDWLEYVFHYNEMGRLQERLTKDSCLKRDLEQMLEPVAYIVAATIAKEYNSKLNTRTKATWKAQ